MLVGAAQSSNNHQAFTGGRPKSSMESPGTGVIKSSVARNTRTPDFGGGPAQKSVRFHGIEIRDYERVVGDNPSCSSGPPIGIGWAHGKTRVLNIDSYEHSRSERKTQRKLVLNRQNREELLANWDVPVSDIVEAIRGNVRVKNQRRQTVTNLGKAEKLEEAFESATRKLKNALLLRRRTEAKLKGYPARSRIAPSHASMGALKPREGAHFRDFHKNPAAGRTKTDQETKEVKDEAQFSWKSEDHAREAPSEIVYENDDGGSSISGFTLANSTTPSILEIERFYRDLELEMFGDIEPPSMVGQTLEVPGVHIPDDQVHGGDRADESEFRKGPIDLNETSQLHRQMMSQDDLYLNNNNGDGRTYTPHELSMNDDDEPDASSSSVSRQITHETRIPQYFHDANEESPHPAMYGEAVYDNNHRLSRSLESLDLNHNGNARNLGGAGGMPTHYSNSLPPMHSNQQYPINEQRLSQDRRMHQLRDGPEIRYMPLQSGISSSQFMGEGIPGQFNRSVHEPVTICEDTDGEDQLLFGAGQPYRGQQYFNQEQQYQDPNNPPQNYYR